MTGKKPAHIKLLEGNRGHRPIATDEPRGLGEPTPRATLTEKQLRCWQEVVGSLPVSVLTAADNAVLERMAVAWATFQDADARINTSGVLVQGRDGNVVRNPLLIVRKQAAEEMHLCGMVLGLSPLSRTRLKQKQDEGTDDLSQLMGEMTLLHQQRTNN